MERKWDWHIDEMKLAASLESPLQPNSHFTPSGFTPINRPPVTQEPPEMALVNKGIRNTKNNTKAKGPAKRTSAASANEPAPKKRKASSGKTGKKTKAAELSLNQDVLANSQNTKPMSAAKRKLSTKTAVSMSSSVNALQAEPSHLSPMSYRTIRHDVPSSRTLLPSGLTQTYQAAYAVPNHSCIDPSLLVKETERSSDCSRKDPLESGFNDTKFHNRSDVSFEDSAVPQSAQRCGLADPANEPYPWGDLSTTGTLTGDVFNSDEIFDEPHELDEFFLADQNLAELMQHGHPNGELQRLDYCEERANHSSNDLSGSQNLKHEGLRQTEPSVQFNNMSSSNTIAICTLKNQSNQTASSTRDALPSRTLSPNAGNATKAAPPLTKVPGKSEECFDDDDPDEELADLDIDGSDITSPQTPLTSPEKTSTPKLQWLPPKTYTPAKSSPVAKSPCKVPQVNANNNCSVVPPFVRPPFPKSIRDRSPILGLTNRTVLRTCFRIGEAFNAAATASRANVDAVIELYARIISSEREANDGFKQFFQLGDLFTDKPPYLSGTYNLWKGVELWDFDSKALIGEKGRGKMVRVMGRIKRREKDGGCEMVILSVWEVDWDDVEVAKGIVCS